MFLWWSTPYGYPRWPGLSLFGQSQTFQDYMNHIAEIYGYDLIMHGVSLVGMVCVCGKRLMGVKT